VTPLAIRGAVELLTASDACQCNKFRSAITSLSEKLAAAGGVRAAVDAIIQHAKPDVRSHIEDCVLLQQPAVGDTTEMNHVSEVPKTQTGTSTAMTGIAMNLAGA